MIRLTLLTIAFALVAAAAVRYWYHALCGLVLLTVLTQHPSMPSNMFGVQGLNPWNALLAIIVVFWLGNRRREVGRLAPPPAAVILLTLFVGMTILSGLIAAMDSDSVRGPAAGKLTTTGMIVNTIINPLKYLLIGCMFFDGARSPGRVRLALFTGVGGGILYALLLFKSMKTGVFTIDFEDARRLTDKLVGLFANDLAELFAFTVWAGILLCTVIKRRFFRAAWLLLVAAILPPFLALKSRAGFVAIAAVGMTLGALRWRWMLVAVPLAAGLTAVTAPGVRERVLMGIEGDEASWDEISAGRVTNIWPPIVEQIKESPFLGHGRFAILRERCFEEILIRERSVPSHPHCSYLEILVDAGLIGLGICIACSLALLRVGWRLARDSRTPEMTALGGIAVAALVAELAAGVTGSSFFPTQSAVPYLCIWGTAVRVYAEQFARRSARVPAQVPAYTRRAPARPRLEGAG